MALPIIGAILSGAKGILATETAKETGKATLRWLPGWWQQRKEDKERAHQEQEARIQMMKAEQEAALMRKRRDFVLIGLAMLLGVLAVVVTIWFVALA